MATMGRFEVQILARRLEVILEGADAAYQWLDAHAHAGERYQLSAVTPDGDTVAIESGHYVPRPGDRGSASRG
jgi:hypothetical protein